MHKTMIWTDLDREISRTIWRLCRDHWRPLAAVLAIGISQTVIGQTSLVFFQRILDGLPAARQLSDLAPALAAYIGLTVLNHALIYLEGYPNSLLVNRVGLWVRQQALEKIARIDYLAYENLGTGNLVQTIDNGASAVRGILTGFYMNIARGIIPGALVSLAFIEYYDRTLFLAVLACYVLFLPGVYYLMRALRAEMEKMLANQQDYSRYSVRAFMELVVFRLNRRFQAEIERIRGISDELVRSKAKIYLLQELFATGFALLIFIVEAGVVVQQAAKILAGQSTVGTLVALVAFVRIVFWPVTQVNWAWINYRLDAVTFKRYASFLALPEDPGMGKGRELEIGAGAICFRQVSFAYPEQEVLRNFSLELKGGRTTALVGASGSGKSTLVRLLLHLVRPQAGEVCVDGQSLAGVNLDSYYRKVAYIPQDAPVFDGTLRENLAFGQARLSEKMPQALSQTGLDELVSRLPQGLETLVGERGVKLSGGERQRLAFARLLLQDPRIVVLDEPTSALDSLSEDFLARGLREFLRGRTVLVVAHRLQTVRDADEILVLEGGCVYERGRFEELISAGGKFQELWEKQSREAGD